MSNTKNKKILVSIPKHLANDINQLSKELNQNKSALVSKALEFYFDHLDLQIAKQRSIEKNKTFSLEQIRKLSDTKA